MLFLCGLWMVGSGAAAGRTSLLYNDPEVVYFEGTLTELLVVQPAAVFGNKNAQRRLAVFPVDTKVKLLGISENGYMVKGRAKHGMVTGWVSPKKLASKDPDFVNHLKAYYTRSLAIRELIEAKEVAIGMTVAEVQESIGQPDRQESRVTQDGRSGKWEYIKSKEQKHYVNSIDRVSGQIFRRYSHTTEEVTEKLTVEFEKDVVTAISRLKDTSSGDVKIVVPPVIFRF